MQHLLDATGSELMQLLGYDWHAGVALWIDPHNLRFTYADGTRSYCMRCGWASSGKASACFCTYSQLQTTFVVFVMV